MTNGGFSVFTESSGCVLLCSILFIFRDETSEADLEAFIESGGIIQPTLGYQCKRLPWQISLLPPLWPDLGGHAI